MKIHPAPAAPRLRHGVRTSLASTTGFMEWEEMPSLVHLITQDASGTRGFADTLRADLLSPEPSHLPFREDVQGLQVREVLDMDVFLHLFRGV